MITKRQLFFHHLAQTSPEPPAFEFIGADGAYLIDQNGRKFFDLISGISVSSLGHQNVQIKDAIHKQVDKHLHLMVYGEFIIQAQIELVDTLVKLLPDCLSSVYLTNSGTEATEGAMKLAKRYTGRTDFVSFTNSYHGSTQGALSLSGSDFLKDGYRPLLPGCKHIDYNSFEQLSAIDQHTAAVFIEYVQAESGVQLPSPGFLKTVRDRCHETGALLIADEIQTGMGRTGKLFAFEHENIVPDVLLLGKGFGAGMPLAAFISSTEIMKVLTHDPVLGHLTTFGGHPVSCAAASAGFDFILKSNLLSNIAEKEKLFHQLLQHPKIKAFRSSGLLMALEFENETINRQIISQCFKNSLVTDWFLFAPDCLRLAPPLTITMDEIREICNLLIQSLNEV